MQKPACKQGRNVHRWIEMVGRVECYALTNVRASASDDADHAVNDVAKFRKTRKAS